MTVSKKSARKLSQLKKKSLKVLSDLDKFYSEALKELNMPDEHANGAGWVNEYLVNKEISLKILREGLALYKIH